MNWVILIVQSLFYCSYFTRTKSSNGMKSNHQCYLYSSWSLTENVDRRANLLINASPSHSCSSSHDIHLNLLSIICNVRLHSSTDSIINKTHRMNNFALTTSSALAVYATWPTQIYIPPAPYCTPALAQWQSPSSFSEFTNTISYLILSVLPASVAAELVISPIV